MASGVYAKGIGAMCAANIDWDDTGGTTIKAMLVKSGYTPDFDTEDFYDDISANKVTGTTDQSLTTRTVTYDAANNRVHLDGPATLTWSAVGPTPAETMIGVVIYKDTGTPGTSALICYNEFSASKSTNGSDVQVTFDTDGHVRFTY